MVTTIILAIIAIEIGVMVFALMRKGDDKWKEETEFRMALLSWHEVANQRALERNDSLDRIATCLERRMQ